MSLFGNPIVYGLTQDNNLEDVSDTFSALNNITLNPYDLGNFAGIGRYLNSDTVHILNNTNENIKVTYNRLKSDASQHNTALSLGTDTTYIDGNITVYGPVVARTIFYYSLDNYNTNTYTFDQLAASTSTASVWSTTNTGIQYTGDLVITEGTSISAKGLKYNAPVKNVNFPLSETATHSLQISANGKKYLLYVTKDIPYILPATSYTYIQNINITVSILSGSVPLSYIIKEYSYPSAKVLTSAQYIINTNRGSKNIIYNGAYSSKVIELYNPPNNFYELIIPNLGLSQLPTIILPNLEKLDISSNRFSILPTLSTLTPSVSTLILDSQVTGFNNNVDTIFVSNLPQKLTYLSMANGAFRRFINTIGLSARTTHTFTPYSVLEILPLQTLKLGSGNFQGVCPSVSATCISYEVQSNSFSALPETGLFRPCTTNNITNLNFSGNVNLALTPTTSASYMSGGYYSDKLKTLSIQNTQLPIPDFRNKTSLETFTTNGSYFNNSIAMPTSSFSLIANDGVYKFNSCSSLYNINISNIPYNFAGLLPDITNTSNLQYINYDGVDFTGAQAGNNYGIYTSTFAGCKSSLITLLYRSTYTPASILPVENDAFNDFTTLQNLTIRTCSLSGATPALRRCNSLTTLNIGNNNTSIVGGFNSLSPLDINSNTTLKSVDMSYNSLSGVLDTNIFIGANADINFTNLVTLNFNHNYFDTLILSRNLPNLNSFDLSYNKLKNIPSFEYSKQIKNINLSYNNITSYSPSAFRSIDFSTNTRVNINLAYNSLSSIDVENIITDLYVATKSTSAIAQFTLDLTYQTLPYSLTNIKTIYDTLTSVAGGQSYIIYNTL